MKRLLVSVSIAFVIGIPHIEQLYKSFAPQNLRGPLERINCMEISHKFIHFHRKSIGKWKISLTFQRVLKEKILH